MKVIQVNGAWQEDGSFKARNMQKIQDTSAASYNDWNTVTNILKLIVAFLYVYKSKDEYLYVSADGYIYGTKSK